MGGRKGDHFMYNLGKARLFVPGVLYIGMSRTGNTSERGRVQVKAFYPAPTPTTIFDPSST